MASNLFAIVQLYILNWLINPADYVDYEQAQKWMDVINEYGISYVAWNLSNKNETSALISSSCNKTSDFTESDLSETGKWLYKTLTGNSTVGNSKDAAKNNQSGGKNNSQNNSNNGQGKSHLHAEQMLPYKKAHEALCK